MRSILFLGLIHSMDVPRFKLSTFFLVVIFQFTPLFSFHSMGIGVGAYGIGAGDVGESHKSADLFLLRRGDDSRFAFDLNLQIAIDKSSDEDNNEILFNFVPEATFFPFRRQYLLLNPYLSLGVSFNSLLIWPTLGIGFYSPAFRDNILINAYMSSGIFSSSVGITIGYIFKFW